MRKTKIICTVGPACASEEMLKKMILAGMNVARINFSHGVRTEHAKTIGRLKKLRQELNLPLAILLDTKGPEIRTRKLQDGSCELIAGNEFILTTNELLGNSAMVSTTYMHLPRNLCANDVIFIDDGLIELKVKSTTETDILCDIVSGGILKDSKSINVPGVSIDMPFLSENDKADLLVGVENNVDYIALSFVRTAQDVKEARRFLQNNGNFDIGLIAKIENSAGVKNIEEIINIADGIMIARGDMGVEIAFEELPSIQKNIIARCCRAGKKVITATQMLESMIHNHLPTRAEVTDVANAIYDGTSAVMLSGETAIGEFALKSLETMSKIAEKTESKIDYSTFGKHEYHHVSLGGGITNAIGDATCRAAQDLGAAAIIVVTLNGNSARTISSFRPGIPIIALTPNEKVYMQMALSWGITPLMNGFIQNEQDLFSEVLNKVEESGFVKSGDIVVITGSSRHLAGITNTLEVHIVGNVLLKGLGNGAESVSGRVCVIKDIKKDLGLFMAGDILAVPCTTNDILHLMRQCSGIITEESAVDSGIVAAGCALDLAVIYAAENATSVLRVGSKIKIDARSGYVYNCNSH
ncbi:MAG: pyruvate kinase [Firmicutes bacterium]|nr:pyruvate kinase [Bacillota bacterium]